MARVPVHGHRGIDDGGSLDGSEVTRIAAGVPGTGSATSSSGSAAVSVTDGSTTVSSPTMLDFTEGAMVTSLGAGVAGIAPDWGAAADIGVEAFGSTASAGASGKVADAAHVHEMPAAPAGAALEVLDEGISLTAAAASIDFVGAGVTATAVGGAVTVTIPGGGGGDTSGLIGAGFDGGLSVLAAGKAQDIVAPFSGTLTGWEVLAQQAGLAVFAIQRSSYASFGTWTDMVGGGSAPELSGADKAAGSIAAWDHVDVTAGDVIRITLSSVSGVRQAVALLAYSRP